MKRNATQAEFSQPRKKIRVVFDAKATTADAGLPLVRALDDRLGLTARFAAAIQDQRAAETVEHTVLDLVRTRAYAILQGYEDCNDLSSLRDDPMFKAACGRFAADRALPSQPTLSRFENAATEEDFVAARQTFLEHYIARHKRRPPSAVTIDIDTTDDPTYGQQEFSFFHGLYDHNCYLQLLMFSGEGDLLWADLLPTQGLVRPWTAWKLTHIVDRLRQAWPGVGIKVRADNGFANPVLYETCEALGVQYLVNVGNHEVLTSRPEVLALQGQAERLFAASGEATTIAVFGEFSYQAQTWEHARRVIVKVQRSSVGFFLRFLVTNSAQPPEDVYADYAMRGQQENWIKDVKRQLKGDRLSCHRFMANAFRLLLFCLSYQLGHELRRRARGDLKNAQLDTLRLRLLRIPATIEETARRVWVHVSSFFPQRRAWLQLAQTLGATAS